MNPSQLFIRSNTRRLLSSTLSVAGRTTPIFQYAAASLVRLSYRPLVAVTQTAVSDFPTLRSSQKESSVSAVQVNRTEALSSERLIVTDSCWDRIAQLAAKRGESLEDFYLRVFVDAGGCSGFTYQFELTDEPIEDDDVVFTKTSSGARVVVDEGSLELMEGATVNYVQEMIKSSFEIQENPLSESACGCGSSFALKNFAANPALD